MSKRQRGLKKKKAKLAKAKSKVLKRREILRDERKTLLKKHMSPDLMISESFVVSQRGYPLDRQPFVMDTTEAIFSSQEICHELNNRS